MTGPTEMAGGSGALPQTGTAGANPRRVATDDPELARALAVAAAVPDPEIPVVTLADLGILKGGERRGGRIVIALTPTYTGCPATLAIRLDVEAALLAAGIADARVETILSPPWSTDDITFSGREKLRAYGIAPPPERSPKGALLFGTDAVACPRCGSTATSRISEFGSTPCKALWRCDDCREPFDVFKCL
ncbi:MAG: 1,2-phenylacetyl-CoA epoxidase subunit PaaD [Hyphomicrobiaceae bacterium]|nr:1,2-phenylacetyl-CoA epoxidase subunit PaaD [Hyphomicrobiaceae bacterium]